MNKTLQKYWENQFMQKALNSPDFAASLKKYLEGLPRRES